MEALAERLAAEGATAHDLGVATKDLALSLVPMAERVGNCVSCARQPGGRWAARCGWGGGSEGLEGTWFKTVSRRRVRNRMREVSATEKSGEPFEGF